MAVSFLEGQEIKMHNTSRRVIKLNYRRKFEGWHFVSLAILGIVLAGTLAYYIMDYLSKLS